MDRDSKVTLDRNEAAEVANIWGKFVARLLRENVERDAHATAALVSKAQHDFLRAIDTQTGDTFLRGNAADFVQALEQALFGESFQRQLAENKAVKKEQAQQAGRRGPEVNQAVGRKVTDHLGKPQRTLTLRRPEEDGR